MLAAAEEARRAGLLVWLGIMVATGLNCATTAHLLDLTPSAPNGGGWGGSSGGGGSGGRSLVYGSQLSTCQPIRGGGGGGEVRGTADGCEHPRHLGGAFCDLDGTLLVLEASQWRLLGGVEWCSGGSGWVRAGGPGHGVTERDQPRGQGVTHDT
mmetsp:Transcript_24694/g.61536  ORF Transcript_24694/g.61536 Transcript_24694/m.61536 type:complete len:154 (-) Transcript_24694:423-884(-)